MTTKILLRGYERVEENVWHLDDKSRVTSFLNCLLRGKANPILEE